MKLTPVQLAKRFEQWQRRLPLLGVGHWRIEAVSLCEQTPTGPDAKATAHVSNAYDSVHFWMTFEFLENATESELDETIIHEWVHVAFRDFDVAIEAAEDSMSKGESDAWEDRIDHAREGLVDRVARQIYRLWLHSNL